jgi:peptide deformylase
MVLHPAGVAARPWPELAGPGPNRPAARVRRAAPHRFTLRPDGAGTLVTQRGDPRGVALRVCDPARLVPGFQAMNAAPEAPAGGAEQGRRTGSPNRGAEWARRTGGRRAGPGPALRRGALSIGRAHGYIAAMTDLTPDAPLLPILIAPHKTLKTKARRVLPADMEQVRALVPRMFATMYKAPGIGLAAPQIDVALRLVVIDLAPDDVNQPLVLINPEILNVSEAWATREEGCLSVPGQYAEVSRPARVLVGYTDLDGAKRQVEGDGLMAACLQHEIDHLDGVLFVDHLSTLKRNMILRRLAKEQKQKALA